MKILMISLLLMAGIVRADGTQEEECIPAVDAADSMDMNRKECDYSDKGLNGFLHRAFKQHDDGAVLKTNVKSEKNAEEAGVASHHSDAQATSHTATNFTLKVEVDQWANLPVARAQLLPKALEQCGGRGFSIVDEHYRSRTMGRIELSLGIECDR